jgi:hypothetical protein
LPPLDVPHPADFQQQQQQWHHRSGPLRSTPDRAEVAPPGSLGGALQPLALRQSLGDAYSPGHGGSAAAATLQQQQAAWQQQQHQQQQQQQQLERDREHAHQLAVIESRAAAAERAALEASHAARLQQQHVAVLAADLARATAEVGDLRGRRDAATAAAATLTQQVAGLSSELRRLEGRLSQAWGAAAEGGRTGEELRGGVAELSERLQR